MSYNVSRVNVKEIDVWVSGRELRQLYNLYKDDLAEGNLFDNLDLLSPNDDEKVKLTSLRWYGVCSGRYFEDAYLPIIKSLHGSAKFSVVWEDGETYYYILKDGELKTVEPVW